MNRRSNRVRGRRAINSLLCSRTGKSRVITQKGKTVRWEWCSSVQVFSVGCRLQVIHEI